MQHCTNCVLFDGIKFCIAKILTSRNKKKQPAFVTDASTHPHFATVTFTRFDPVYHHPQWFKWWQIFDAILSLLLLELNILHLSLAEQLELPLHLFMNTSRHLVFFSLIINPLNPRNPIPGIKCSYDYCKSSSIRDCFHTVLKLYIFICDIEAKVEIETVVCGP